MAHGDLREFLDAHLPRFHVLQGASGGSTRPVEDAKLEAITELGLALEELRVIEEELRVQNELLAESQQALQSERERYRSLFAHFPAACVVTDAAAVVRDANAAAARLLGVRADALPGKPFPVFVAEEDRRELRRRLVHGFHDDAERAWTLRLKPRRGAETAVSVSVLPVQAAPGDFHLVWSLHEGGEPGAGRDVEGAVLGAVVDALPVAALVLDVDETVLRWNAAAEALLGWREAEITGCPCPALEGAGAAALRDAVLHREAAPGLSVELARADGRGQRVRVAVAPLGEGGARRGTLVTVLGPAEEEAGSAPAPRVESLPAADARMLLEGARASEVDRRVREGVASALYLRRLRPGSRLPSIRELAATAGADHRAVAAAYRDLAAEGVVEVRTRQGAFVADPAVCPRPELPEGPGWLAGALADAAELQLRVPHLPDLVRRWTGARAVRCACVESVEDERVALVEEMRGQWGMDAYPVPVPLDAARARPRGEPALLEALRDADLVVTTPFHAPAARAAAKTLGVPVVVLTLGPEVVEAVEARLAEAPLAAVVADPAYGERLRALPGGERLRVVTADDAPSLAALEGAGPVLLTRAAHRRLAEMRLRMLVPFSAFHCRDADRALAAALVACNLGAGRG